MKFNKPQLPTGSDGSGGQSGIPSWRRRWIEEKVNLVKLECGCVEDISIPAIIFINTFDGAEIDCAKCQRFVRVIKKMKYDRTVKTPSEPLF